MARLRSRLFHLYFRFSRPMTLGVRAFVWDGAGRIFLVRHTYVPGWYLPGGGVEAGETVLDALEKELREEGNLRIESEPEMFGIYLNAKASNRDHVVLYNIRSAEQIEAPKPNREIAESGFFALDALPADTTASTRDRLAEFAGERKPSSYW